MIQTRYKDDYERTKPEKSHSTYTKSFQRKTFCEYCKRPGHAEADCFRNLIIINLNLIGRTNLTSLTIRR